MSKPPAAAAQQGRPGRRVAVADIGSNAVRLLVGRQCGGQVLVESFTRVPLSLGKSALGAQGARRIPAPLQRRLVHVLSGMAHLAAAQRPCPLRAVATAALREAANQKEVLAAIHRACGVRVRVLSGRQEAALVGRYAAAHFPQAKAVLNADIGGGSTDCALVQGGRLVAAETFQLGTARADGGTAEEKARCQEWLRAHLPAGAVVSASGGSAAVLETCAGGITPRHLAAWQRRIANLSPTQLTHRHPAITPDRAAHITEALTLYRLLLKATPQIHPIKGGLAQAMIMTSRPSC